MNEYAAALLIAISVLTGCVQEKVVEHWIGPGRQDGSIVTPGPEANAVHPVQSGYYAEWWYFDTRLDNGYVVIGFLQAAELMTGKPGVELHIYKPSGEKLSVRKSYPASAISASREKCDVKVGKNYGYVVYPPGGGLPEYHLYISEDGLSANLTFKNEIPAWMPGKGKTEYGDRGLFAWVVPVPRARVTGEIRIKDETIPARGIGYHDHNWVTADMKDIISHWYWGRLYADDYTLLFAHVKANSRFGGKSSNPLMLAHRGTIILSTGEMTVTAENIKFNRIADRDYPGRLILQVPGKLKLTLNVKKIIDADDFLKDFNPALKWAINSFIGRPGYFRFLSDYRLEITLNGKIEERTGTILHEMVALP